MPESQRVQSRASVLIKIREWQVSYRAGEEY
jgi:hypothetical protein